MPAGVGDPDVARRAASIPVIDQLDIAYSCSVRRRSGAGRFAGRRAADAIIDPSFRFPAPARHERSQPDRSPFACQVRRRPARAAHRRPGAAARRGPLHRRPERGRPGLRLHREEPARARRPAHGEHCRGEGDAGRARGVHGRGPRRLRLAQVHRAARQPRRHADEEARAALARLREGALRRRPGGVRGGRDVSAGEGRGRGDRARHRAAARGVARERSGARGRAAALRRRAGQRGVRFPLRRRREGRRGLRRRGARDQAPDPQHARGGGGDGAAHGDLRLRQGERALHAHHAEPGRVLDEGPVRRNSRRARRDRCGSAPTTSAAPSA